MSQDPQPLPLDAGTPVPDALDHAWVVESMDQQYSFNDDGASTWTARVRCVHCGVRVAFDACGVPPCRAGQPEAQPEAQP